MTVLTALAIVGLFVLPFVIVVAEESPKEHIALPFTVATKKA